MESHHRIVKIALQYRTDTGEFEHSDIGEVALSDAQDIRVQITNLPGFPPRLREQRETFKIFCADGTAWQPGCWLSNELYALFDDVAEPILRTQIMHATRHHATTESEFLSLRGLRAEHLVLAEPIDNSFQALLYANDDGQPKTINLAIYSPDKLESMSDYEKGFIVISDNGVGMNVKRITNWATDHYRPSQRIIPEEDPNPDQDSWKDPNPHPPGTADHEAFEERRKRMEYYFCDGRLAKRGTGSKAAGFHLGTDLLMITKMKGEMVRELRLSKAEYDEKDKADKPWYQSEVIGRPRGSWKTSFVETKHYKYCKSLVQHVKDMEAKHEHFTIFVISSLIPHRAMHILGHLETPSFSRNAVPDTFVSLCRQLRHMYFFMLSLGDKPYVGGAVELTAEFVRFKRSNGEKVFSEKRSLHDKHMEELADDDDEMDDEDENGQGGGDDAMAGTAPSYVDRHSLLHKWAAKRPGGSLDAFEFTIDSGSDGYLGWDGELKCYGEQIKVRLWYLPSHPINTLHKKRVDWPREQQLEVLYKGRLMPYEFVDIDLLPLGLKGNKDSAVVDQLSRVRGAIFLGSNQAVHNTKWSLNPSLAERLKQGLKSNSIKSTDRYVKDGFQSWLATCHEEYDKRVTLSVPFRVLCPQDIDPPLFQRMKYGKATYAVGQKVVVEVKRAVSADYMKIVGSIVGFKEQEVPRVTPSKPVGGRGRGRGRRGSGTHEADGGMVRWPSGVPGEEGAAECIIFLLREPQSVFACPEGVVPSPHLWEVSSRYLREQEDPDRWIAAELDKIPRTITATYAWLPPSLVCHQPVESPTECITRLELRNAGGGKVPVNWETRLQTTIKRCKPKITRRVFRQESPTDDGPGRELASLFEEVTLTSLQTGFEFPSFVVHKPGTYKVVYSLEEPQLPWGDDLRRPTYSAMFEGIVGLPMAFELDFPTLRRLPSPGTNSQPDGLPAVRLNEPFEVAIRFFDKEQQPEDDVETSRNACTEFDPTGLHVRVSPADRLPAVHVEVVGPATGSGKGQPLRAVVLLTRADAHRPAKIALGGTVQAVTFTLKGPGQACSPIRQQLLMLPGPAVLQPKGEEDDGGASDFVGLEGVSQVVNREGPLRFKVRFHDSEGNETRCFPPHSRVKLLLTHPRVAPGGAGNQPEVLLERCAVFGADGTLDSIPSAPSTSAAACQGDLFLDEEGDIAVHGLRLNLDFSHPAHSTSVDGDHGGEDTESVLCDTEVTPSRTMDIQVSLEVPAGGNLAAGSFSRAEQAHVEPVGVRRMGGLTTITKVKAIQVLPSSRPSRVRLCFQDGPTWRECPVAEPGGGIRLAGEGAKYEFRRILAGEKLPKLAVRIDSETGEKLLGPPLQGDGQEVAGPGQVQSPCAGRVFQFKLAEAGAQYKSTPEFQRVGIIAGLAVSRKAGRHLLEIKVKSARQVDASGGSQSLTGSRQGRGQEVEFKQKVQIAATIIAGSHTKWSIVLIPEQTPKKKRKPSGTQQVATALDAVSHNGPPRLTLGQPLSQSRLAFVAMDAFDNCVVVEGPPTLRVVPRRAGESAQEPVTFLAEPMRAAPDSMDVDEDDEETQADVLGQARHAPFCENVRPMDTLPGGYLRKVIGGQDSDYFCFCGESEAYLYRQEPLLPSSSSTGLPSSADYAIEVSSVFQTGTRVISTIGVDIRNPPAASNGTIHVHGLPDSYLMSWQEISGAWAEVRVGPLPGGHSVRALDPRIKRLCLEAVSAKLQLVAKDSPQFATPSTPVELRETRRRGHQAARQQGAANGAAGVPAPVPLAADDPGSVTASLAEDQDGRYIFPPVFAVRTADGPSSQGEEDLARVAVRAATEGAGIHAPQEKILDFTWRSNPSLVKALAVLVGGAKRSMRYAITAGSPKALYSSMVELTGEDGITRDAMFMDAPALRVTLVRPGVPGSDIRLEAKSGLEQKKAYFVMPSDLTIAGAYQVVATWRDDRIPDRRTDVTGSCSFDVIPGPSAKLVASHWQPACFDNLSRTQLFSKLEVYCVDSYGNRTADYAGTLVLSVHPKNACSPNGEQAQDYAALANGNPTFEMDNGAVTIPAQHLQARAGRVDGDYVLQVATAPGAVKLDPLRLDFSFSNQHGLSERVQAAKERVTMQQDTLMKLEPAYQDADWDHRAAEEEYARAYQRGADCAASARALVQACAQVQLPPPRSPACKDVLQHVQSSLRQALASAQEHAGLLEKELSSRPYKDGLTHDQRLAVAEAQRNGQAYGTLTMLTVVENAGDARLLSCLSGSKMRMVVLKPNAPQEVRRRLRGLGLPNVVINEVKQYDEEQLPHEGLLAPADVRGNPRFGTSVVTVNSDKFKDDPMSARLMRGVIHAAIGRMVILDKERDAESYAANAVDALRQRRRQPWLPRIVSQDGRYERDSNGIEWPKDADFQKRLQGPVVPCFGAPTLANSPGLRMLREKVRSMGELLEQLSPAVERFTQADMQLQQTQKKLEPLQQARQEGDRELTRRKAQLHQAEEEQRAAEARASAARAAPAVSAAAAPAGSAEVDSDAEQSVRVGGRRHEPPERSAQGPATRRARMAGS